MFVEISENSLSVDDICLSVGEVFWDKKIGESLLLKNKLVKFLKLLENIGWHT